MKKRIIAAAVAAATIFFSLPVSADDVQESINLYFLEKFDSVKQGAMTVLDNWTVVANENRFEITSRPDGKEGNCLEFVVVQGAKGGPYVEKRNLGVAGNFIAECNLWAEDPTRCITNIFFVRNALSNDCILLKINAMGQLLDVNNSIIKAEFPTGRFVKLAVSVNAENATYDIYMNNRKIKSGIKIPGVEKMDASTIRTQISNVQSGCSAKLYIDDYAMYSTESGSVARKGLENIQNAGVGENLNDGYLYMINNNKMLRRGYAVEFAEGEDVAPRIVRGKPYIPLRYSVEMMYGASVHYDKNTRNATANIGENTLVAEPGKNAAWDGNYLLVDAEDFAAAADKKLWYDEAVGLLFMSDNEKIVSYMDSIDTLSDAVAEFIYERPSGKKIVEDVKNKNPNKAHPRILIGTDGFEKMKERIGRSEYLTQSANKLIAAADGYLEEEPRGYIKNGYKLTESSQVVQRRIMNLAIAYHLTDDVKYAERAWDEVKTFCTVWPDWSNYHFLDTGEAAAAAAIAYDWLYDYWNDEQRKTIETAIIERAINGIMEDYNDVVPRERASGVNPGWTGYKNNWSFICSGGVGMGALAICDANPEYEELCSEMLGFAVREMENTLKTYAPDGGFIEGPSYWSYTGRYLSYIIESFKTATGSDYGYEKTPGLSNTAYFVADMMGPGGSFNFSDSSESYSTTSPTMLWFAKAYGKEDIQQAYVKMQKDLSLTTTYLHDELLWYMPEYETVPDSERLDAYYRNAETVSLRDSLDFKNGNYIGLHAGENGISHYHMDCGTFVLDMNGNRFAYDLGRGTYNENGGHFRYRYSAQGHNTWVINPDNTYSQNEKAFTKIERFESNKYEGYAIADLTDAYKGKVDSIRRGVLATEGKSVFVVQDEIKAEKPAECYWQMHTKADIEILEGGKQAILAIDDDRVLATILTDNNSGFEVRKAVPYDGTPNYKTSETDADSNRNKLVIHFNDVTDETVAVEFQHFFKEEEPPQEHVSVKPLDEWALGEIKEEWTKEPPRLNSININGKQIEGFEPDIMKYRLQIDEKDETGLMVDAEADSDVDVKVTYPESYPGSIFISVSSGMRRTGYVVNVNVSRDMSKYTDSQKLKIVGVEASSEPQPQNNKNNAIDGDYGTRWSAKGRNNIDFDLGEVKQVDYISLAYYNGDKRVAYFRILTSLDGKDWTLRYDNGQTSGLTNGDEFYPVAAAQARYIRVDVQGTDDATDVSTSWNSITEFKAFGK